MNVFDGVVAPGCNSMIVRRTSGVIDLAVGATITGEGIAEDTKIIAISGDKIVLSHPVIAAGDRIISIKGSIDGRYNRAELTQACPAHKSRF